MQACNKSSTPQFAADVTKIQKMAYTLQEETFANRNFHEFRES